MILPFILYNVKLLSVAERILKHNIYKNQNESK